MESRQFTRKKPVYPQRTGRHTRQIAHQAIRTLSDTVLAGIAQRRADGVLNPEEQSIREEILFGLLVDRGGEAQISTAMRVLAKIIASHCRCW